MNRARVELTWDPDGQRKRVRRTAAMTVVVLVVLLWALAVADSPGVHSNGTATTGAGTTTTTTSATTTTATTTTTQATTTQLQEQPVVTPALSLTASTVDFGDRPVGSAAGSAMTFRNDGTVPFTANAIVFAGVRAAAFEISLGNCGLVSPGASCTAAVVFRPAEVREEKAQVALLDVSGARSAGATLSGRGTPPAPVPPPPWHHVGFETVLVEVALGFKVPVTVRNTGEDEATIGQIAIDDNASFNVDPTQCQNKQKLAPGEACVVVVTLALRDQAVHVSNLRLFSADKHQEDVAAVINRAISRPGTQPQRFRIPTELFKPSQGTTTTLH